MGLITGLLTLPLAPVRGTAWLAEQIRDQAEAELYDEGEIRERLMELEDLYDAGEIDEQERQQAEDALLEHLVTIRRLGEEGPDGTVGS